MKITRVQESKLKGLDFESIEGFGYTFADHMLIATCKDGVWGAPEIRPFGNLSFSPALMALHYGQAIFEGMKCFKDEAGEVHFFRADKNFERLNKSAERLNMTQIPEEIFMEGLQTLIDLDRDWVPPYPNMSLYIRPVYFASEEVITARAAKEYTLVILTAVAPDYYNKRLKVKIAQDYSRAAKGGVGYAKAAGNYAASFYPTEMARTEGYDQIIWTDAENHELLEEAGTMNIFVRMGDELYTAPTSDRILNGVTRNSLIQLATDMGIKVNEASVNWHDMKKAHENGELKEVFGCGTAVVVNNFSGIGYPDGDIDLPDLSFEESFGKQLKSKLMDIQYNRAEDNYGWRKQVERKG